MNKRELKIKIRDSFEVEKPDILSSVTEACEREQQLPKKESPKVVNFAQMKNTGRNVYFKRLVACAVCLMLFVSGFSVGYYIPTDDIPDTPEVSQDVSTFVYLDVNPSIELQIDDSNKVIKCLPNNEDAETILSGLKLDGVDMNTALTAIIGSMYVNKYLTEDSNSILVSVDSKNEEKETLLTEITDKINTVFENTGLECSIIAQSLDVNDELKERADKNGVSVGKMHLVDKMITGIDDLNEENEASLTDMSIKELNLIYSTRPNKDKNDHFDKDISVGNVGGFVKQDDALTTLLEAIEKTADDVESYQIRTKLGQGSGKKQMVYSLDVKFKNDTARYEFEVDCQTGEVVKIDSNIEHGHTTPDNVPQAPSEKNEDIPHKEDIPEEEKPKDNPRTDASREEKTPEHQEDKSKLVHNE